MPDISLEQRVIEIENRLNQLDSVGLLNIVKLMKFNEGVNIQAGKNTGTKIGTETSQKLGFFSKTPIIQPGAISAPSGGTTIDSQARSAITSLINALHNLGLTA